MPTDEEIEQYIERLKAHRRTLALYLQQRAEFGNAFLPPHIAHGIVEARGNIASIKRTLRDWGVDVEDHPDDEDVIIEQTKKLGTKLSKVPQLLVACSVLLFSILFLVNIFTNRRSAESVVGTPQRETNLSTALSTISSSNEDLLPYRKHELIVS